MKVATAKPVTHKGDVGAYGLALRELEGREVSLALADGSRLDAVALVSAGRGRTPTVWIYAAGIDVFVPRPHIIEAWESPPVRAESPPVRAA